MPPWHTYVPPSGRADASGHSIAYLSNGGNWKLFDPSRMFILTRPIWGGKSPEVVDVRQFEKYFNIPSSEIIEATGQLWRRDEYVGDTTLVQCGTSLRASMVLRLFEQYGRFAETHRTRPDLQLTEDALTTIDEIAPASIPARIAVANLASMRVLGGCLALLPAHGDLSAQNVLVRDGQPWIIDWDQAGRSEPILYDLLYLIRREAELGRSDLVQAFLEGAFDDQVRALLSSVGLSSIPCGNLMLLVHAFLVHFHRKKQNRHRDTTSRNVEAAWNALRPYCRAFL